MKILDFDKVFMPGLGESLALDKENYIIYQEIYGPNNMFCYIMNVFTTEWEK